MAKTYLDKVYDLDTVEDTRKHYDEWSDSYDDEVKSHGYATPRRVALALRKFAPTDMRLLDFGCGTGLSGVALKNAGFEDIDGIDLSEEMLEKARETGVYKRLLTYDPDRKDSFPEQSYDAIVACGVIGAGAAPLSVFDELMGKLPKGGLLAFSFNDHTLADRCYEARINEYVDCAAARLLFREHGPHLPGIELKSMVYVVEKM